MKLITYLIPLLLAPNLVAACNSDADCSPNKYCKEIGFDNDGGVYSCIEFAKIGEDCEGIRCGSGLKCDSNGSLKCVDQKTELRCTKCGDPFYSNGPCCNGGIQGHDGRCLCATGEGFCTSNAECKYSGGCCNTNTNKCTSDQGYC